MRYMKKAVSFWVTVDWWRLLPFLSFPFSVLWTGDNIELQTVDNALDDKALRRPHLAHLQLVPCTKVTEHCLASSSAWPLQCTVKRWLPSSFPPKYQRCWAGSAMFSCSESFFLARPTVSAVLRTSRTSSPVREIRTEHGRAFDRNWFHIQLFSCLSLTWKYLLLWALLRCWWWR